MKNNNQKFKKDVEYRIHRIKLFGKKHGWRLTNETFCLLEFESIHNWGLIADSNVQLKINYRQLEIETSLNHPKKGKTMLMRKGDFSMNLIEKIFRNPRSHMPKSIVSQYIS